jgi:hypothetical protein
MMFGIVDAQHPYVVMANKYFVRFRSRLARADLG